MSITRLSGGGTATNHDAYLSSPVGLERIVPISWMLRLPAWAKAPIAGTASWQWLGLAVGLAVCLGLSTGYISPYPASRGPQGRGVGPRLACPPDPAGGHPRDSAPGAVALRYLPDWRERAHRHHLYADGRAVSQRRLAVP
jgi:hypothetical protein